MRILKRSSAGCPETDLKNPERAVQLVNRRRIERTATRIRRKIVIQRDTLTD
jgi:hypothetical protein